MFSKLKNMIKSLFSKKKNQESIKSSSDGTLYIDKKDFYKDKKVQDALRALKENRGTLVKS